MEVNPLRGTRKKGFMNIEQAQIKQIEAEIKRTEALTEEVKAATDLKRANVVLFELQAQEMRQRLKAK